MNNAICYPKYNTLTHSLFDELWGQESTAAERTVSPRARVIDQPQTINVELELPGVRKEDIKVEVKENILSVTAEKKLKTESEQSRDILNERLSGRYSRSFKLGTEIHAEKVDARFENGVLLLTFSKKEESKPRQIEIQ